MTNITETDLTRLGFECQYTWDDFGDDDYYFTMEFGGVNGLCLITNCRNDSPDATDGWVVEFFDNSSTKAIKSLELLEEFINIMNKIQNAN